MKSWSKPAIGLLIASAMVIGTGVVANAAGSADDSAQSQTSSSQTAADPAAHAVSSDQDKAKQKDPNLPQLPKPEEDETKGAQPAPSAQSESQQPQTQDDAAVSDCRGSDTWKNGTATYSLEQTSEGCVFHLHAGTIKNGFRTDYMGNYRADAPWYTSYGYIFTDKIDVISIDGPVTVSDHTLKYLFGGLDGLKKITGLEHIDMTDVTDISELFSGDTGLETLDVSGLNTSDVTTADKIFWGCTSLTSITGLGTWNVHNVTTMSRPFYNDEKLAHIDGIGSWHPDALTSAAEMFYGLDSLTSLDLSGWKGHVSSLTSMREMFRGSYKITSLTGLAGWDVHKVKDLSNAFYHLPSLTTLDLTGWKPSLEGDGASGVFDHCTELTEIKGLENWDVSKATTIGFMFSDDEALTSLDLTGWSPGNATNLSYMFYDNYNLKTIKGLGDWDVHSAKDVKWMFGECKRLTDIGDLSRWNTSSFENMERMFQETECLTDFGNISQWDVSNVTNMNYAFCFSGMTSVDLSGWDTRSLTEAKDAIYCMDLVKIVLGPKTKLLDEFIVGPSIQDGHSGFWVESPDDPSPRPGEIDYLEPLTREPDFAGGTFLDPYTTAVTFNPFEEDAQGETDDVVKYTLDDVTAENPVYLTLPENGYTYPGYKFIGWSMDDPTGTGIGDILRQPGYQYKATKPGYQLFYANWAKVGDLEPTPTPNPIPNPNPNLNPNPGAGQGPINPNPGAGSPVNIYNTRNVFVTGPVIGVAPNAATPTPQHDGLQKDLKGSRSRPKCMPADVAKRLTKKHSASAAAYTESNATGAAWKDSDYLGLPRCAVAQPEATAKSPTHSFNWLWLLLLLLVAIVVATYVYEKNKNRSDQDARHSNGADSGEIAF